MMKKLLTTFLAVTVFMAFSASAQFVIVNSPASIEGSKNFEPAAFGADVNSDVWTADVVFVDDATGTTTDGCEALVNGAELSGKIALIDRGGCEFGIKCLQAEQEGAIAAIVFNNAVGAGPIVMGAGANGGSVTIPCVMLSLEDGQLIRDELMNGAVNITIGNVQFDNNVGAARNAISNFPLGTVPGFQAEQIPLSFEPGAVVTNLGNNVANNVTVSATIEHSPFGGSPTTVYDENGSVPSIESDSSTLILLDAYTPDEGNGMYEVHYTISADEVDESLFDNEVTSRFFYTDNVYSKASWDLANNRPSLTTSFTIAGGGNIEFLSGFSIPEGEGYKLDSILMQVSTGQFSFGVLEGTISAYVYEWVDADGNEVAATSELTVVGLTQVHSPEETLLPDTSATNVWITVPILDFPDFEEGVPIGGDNKRYFVGVRYDDSPGGELVFFGFDENFDQTVFVDQGLFTSDLDLPYIGINTWIDLRPDVDNGFLFTDNRGSSVASLIINPIDVAVEDIQAVTSFSAYPNPANDLLKVETEFTENQAFVQYDIRDAMGRIVSTTRFDNVGTFNQANLNVANLVAGQYYLVVKTENGSKGHPFSVQH